MQLYVNNKFVCKLLKYRQLQGALLPCMIRDFAPGRHRGLGAPPLRLPDYSPSSRTLHGSAPALHDGEVHNMESARRDSYSTWLMNRPTLVSARSLHSMDEKRLCPLEGCRRVVLLYSLAILYRPTKHYMNKMSTIILFSRYLL